MQKSNISINNPPVLYPAPFCCLGIVSMGICVNYRETETFGGLSGMLRQILSPSPETGDSSFLNCCNLQPGSYTSYPSMLSSSVQYIAPVSSPYIHPSHPSAMTSLEQVSSFEHLEVHTESHPCLSCGLDFRSALKLNYHLRTHHQINPNEIRRRYDANINENNNQIKFSCSICGRVFPNLGYLRMHESSHTSLNSPQPIQANVIIANVPMMSPSESNDQTFNCDQCQASFRYRTLLERHKKIHMTNQDKPYSCSRCPMRFETRTLYNHHAKTHKSVNHITPTSGIINTTSNMNHHSTSTTSTVNATIEKPFESPVSYPCDSCPKQFLTIESLTSHKAIHRSRPLVCDVCGKGFTHRKYYVVHQRIHTGERPYLCAMCGKSFTQASTLTVHRRYHTGERPYTCTLCGKGFVTRTIMLNHMKKH
ncbi:gastrula zinc finger protein XlCGF26.1-like [Chelonus insularis]|uniref:gastrula zinc finger protein XlCGF26.1-like n=1 Tax=Chelonus insularis TaxID=460826 RepID=UPI00158C44AC|nr:gastrula zinc finger protein XlCGF26.1-like [Chelonus insularis]